MAWSNPGYNGELYNPQQNPIPVPPANRQQQNQNQMAAGPAMPPMAMPAAGAAVNSLPGVQGPPEFMGPPPPAPFQGPPMPPPPMPAPPQASPLGRGASMFPPPNLGAAPPPAAPAPPPPGPPSGSSPMMPPPMPAGSANSYYEAQGTQFPAPSPLGGAQTLYPAAASQGFNQFVQSGGAQGFLSPDASYSPQDLAGLRGVQGAPMMEPMVDDRGQTFYLPAGSPGTPSTRFGFGMNNAPGMVPFEEFSRSMRHTNIGANTAALQNAYRNMYNQQQTQANANQTTANNTLQTQASYGPNGIFQRAEERLGRAEDRLNFPNTPEGRQQQVVNAALQSYLNPQPGQPRPPIQQLVQQLNQLSGTGLLGGRPGPSPVPGQQPTSGGVTPAGGTPAGGRPAGGTPAGGTTAGNGPFTVPPPGPNDVPYAGLQGSIEALPQFARPSGAETLNPATLVARLQRDQPQLFGDTPEGLANRAQLVPYLNSRFTEPAVRRSGVGYRTQTLPGWLPLIGGNQISTSSNRADMARTGIPGLGLPSALDAFQSLIGGGPTEEMQGGEMLRNILAGRW